MDFFSSGGAGGFYNSSYKPFWAQITGSAVSGAYPWSEVAQNTPGTFTTPSEGRSGTTSAGSAYEINGNAVPTNTYVQMWLGDSGDYYLFEYVPPAAISSTLATYEVNGTALPAATTLNFVNPAFSGGGASSVDKVTLASTPGTGTKVVDQDRTIGTAYCLQGGGNLHGDLSLTVQTSPANAATVVGTGRLLKAGAGIQINGGSSADLSQDDTISCTVVVPTLYYQTVESAGTTLTQRPILNFIGAGGTTVTVTDDLANLSTDVSISSAVPSTGGGFNAYLITLASVTTALSAVFDYTNAGGLHGSMWYVNDDSSRYMYFVWTATRAIDVPGQSSTGTGSFVVTTNTESYEQIDNGPWSNYLPLKELKFQVSCSSGTLSTSYIEVSVNA